MIAARRKLELNFEELIEQAKEALKAYFKPEEHHSDDKRRLRDRARCYLLLAQFKTRGKKRRQKATLIILAALLDELLGHFDAAKLQREQAAELVGSSFAELRTQIHQELGYTG